MVTSCQRILKIIRTHLVVHNNLYAGSSTNRSVVGLHHANIAILAFYATKKITLLEMAVPMLNVQTLVISHLFGPFLSLGRLFPSFNQAYPFPIHDGIDNSL